MRHPTSRAARRCQRERIINNRGRTVRNSAASQYCGFRWEPIPSRFSKKKPYDCGKPGCKHCHYTKFLYPKMRRLLGKKALRESLEDQSDD